MSKNRTTTTIGFEATEDGTRQAVQKANRDYLAITNEDAAEYIYIGIGKPATPDNNSKRVPPQAEWEPLRAPGEALYICTAAGKQVNVNIIEGIDHDQ